MAQTCVTDEFRDFIRSEQFPCVGAKSALVRDAITTVRAERFDGTVSDLDIHRELLRFGSEILDLDGPIVQSFVVIFDGPRQMSEARFESCLWDRLQSLHNIDVAAGYEWTEETSDDPESAHFSLSLGGQAYFVIGLHPNASRKARRFSHPTLVFNSHEQFEALRRDGRYDRMQNVIREREEKFNGGINPMLNDFGLGAEAAQYSGRNVGDDWSCPFSKKDVA
jgi:FPC/CPF motif-containing protein YcgG